MPLVVADRVRETTTTTGTGAVTLAGAVTGYQSFSAVGNGNTTYYTINAGSQWEVGIGTYSGAGPSLSRDTVLESSNSGSLVDFAAGTKDVFLTYPAEKSISDGYGLLPPANGGTGLSSSGTAGNVLTSNGTAWVSQLPAAGGITYTAVKTSNYTASANDGVQTDTSGGAFTVTLPATPAVGAQVIVVDSAGSWGTTNLTIGRNGSTIEGSATDLICNISSVSVQLVYSGTTWDVYAQLGGAAGGLVTVTGGGTGATTLTANGILLGNGISAVSTTAVGATGQVLVGNTGAAPTWSTLSGIGVTSFSGGMTGLTPASATTGAITLAGTLGVANGGTGATTLTSGYLLKGNGTSAVSASVVYDTGTNVGIGTSSPQAKLHLLDTNAVYIQLTDSADGASRVGQNGTAMTFGVDAGNGTTERMRITSVGDVAIGTSSPVGRLDAVSASATGNIINARNTSSSQFFIGGVGLQNGATANNSGVTIGTGVRDADGTDSFFTINKTTSAGSYVAELAYYDLSADFWKLSTSNAERMRIDSSGNVGIGTSSPGSKLDVSGKIKSTALDIGTTVGQTLDLFKIGSANYIWAADAAPILIGTSNTERMRIDASGNLLVGTTSALDNGRISVAFPVATANGITVQTSGTSYFNNLMSFRNSSGTQVGYIYTNGSTTTFTSVSDTRLKENITDADSAGSIIDSIQVRKYDWKADGSHQRYGFVAQELAAVAPEAVHQPEDPDAMMGVDYSKLVPMLVKEIQSLRARMAQMEGK